MSATVAFERVGRDDPDVLSLFAPYIRESDGPLGDAVDLEAEIAAGPPADLVPPGGSMLLIRVGGEPAGIGGVRHLETEVAEVKSMYVAPAHRGTGLGRRLLDELVGIAAAHGCRAVRLDSSSYLTDALNLYRAAGFRPVPDYNGNPKADVWLQREL